MGYQSTCSSASLNKVFFGPCQNYKHINDVKFLYYNSTSPTPTPLSGDRNGGGACDCTIEYNGAGSGSNWMSAFDNGMEQWQGNPTDMLLAQSWSLGGSSSYNQCSNYGWKGVAANRMWYGTLGWTSPDSCPTVVTSNSPDQTKYCKLDINVIYDRTTNDSGGNEGDIEERKASMSGSLTVNSGSGILDGTVAYTDDYWESEPQYNSPCPLNTGDGIKWVEYHTYHNDHGAGWRNTNPQGSTYDAGTNCLTYTTNPPDQYYDHGMSSVLDGFSPDCHCSSSVTIPEGLGSLTDYIANWNSEYTGTSVPLFPEVTDQNNYSGEVSYSNTESGVVETVDIKISWSKGITSYVWNFDSNVQYLYTNGFTAINTILFSGNLALSKPLTSADLVTDLKYLLTYWDLTDNATYPWRTDSWTSFMPLVQRRQVQYEVSPLSFTVTGTVDDYRSPIFASTGSSSGSIIGYNQMPWKDPNSYSWTWKPGYNGQWASSLDNTNYDGTILGQPLIFNGAGAIIKQPFFPTPPSYYGIGWGWFDFYLRDIRFCETPTDIDCGATPPYQQYTYRYGGTLADSSISEPGMTDGPQMSTILPMCTTHWINNFQANAIPKGASIGSEINHTNGLTMVKCAITRVPFPSYNFFRPCGSDRVLVDETTIQCLTGDLQTLGAIEGLTPSSSLLIAFSDSNDGIYTGCSQDGGNNITLGPKVADLPSDYTHAFKDQYKDQDVLGNFGLAGICRFPNAFGICGREQVVLTFSVSASVSGSNVYFLAPQTNLRSHDAIDLFNRSMTKVINSCSVQRVDDSNFYISFPPTASLGSAYYAMSHGAPDFTWNDNSSKMEYRYNSWKYSFRTGSETPGTCQTDCLPFSNCTEQVFCMSPNGESFPNGKTVWFTDTYLADSIFGSLEQMDVEMAINDLLYQTPTCPCSNLGVSIACDQDDGSCKDDYTDESETVHYIYAYPPQVEARCSIPSGAPALPTGITYPSLTRPPLPGNYGYTFSNPSQPWTFYANAISSCNGGACRFHYFWC